MEWYCPTPKRANDEKFPAGDGWKIAEHGEWEKPGGLIGMKEPKLFDTKKSVIHYWMSNFDGNNSSLSLVNYLYMTIEDCMIKSLTWKNAAAFMPLFMIFQCAINRKDIFHKNSLLFSSATIFLEPVLISSFNLTHLGIIWELTVINMYCVKLYLIDTFQVGFLMAEKGLVTTFK